MMDNCCICSTKHQILLKINQITPNNDISIKTQLELLIPELTWLNHYVVCSKCHYDLNTIQKLRQRCLQSQRIREMERTVVEPPITSNKSLLGDPPDTDAPAEQSGTSVKRTKKCQYCRKTFITKAELDVHEFLHLNKQGYFCRKCRKLFDTAMNLHFHNLTKHADPIYWRYHCKLCDKRFPMKGKYDIHMKRHQKFENFKCTMCNKEFTSKIGLKLHLKLHPNFKQFKCELCSKEFNLKQSLYGHKLRTHQISNFYNSEAATEIKVEEPNSTSTKSLPESVKSDQLISSDESPDFKKPAKALNLSDSNKQLVSDPNSDSENICKYCNKIFKTRHTLRIHEKIHLNNLEYNCGKCEKRFNTSRDLSNHNLTEHTDPIYWRFHCELCEKRFPMKSQYDRHIKIHNNIKDFKCHLCDKQFSCNYSLGKHLNVHLNLKQFKCDLCEQEFNLKYTLAKHKFKKHQIGNYKLPSKEKKYICEVCGRAFSKLLYLKNHSYVHLDAPKFKCELCEKTFKHKRSVKPHMVQFHSKTGE